MTKEKSLIKPIIKDTYTKTGSKIKMPDRKELENMEFMIDYRANDKYMEAEYFNMHIRDRKLIDDVTLGVPYPQIYDEYYTPYEKAKFTKDQLLLDRTRTDEQDLPDKTKRNIVIQTISRKQLGKFITARRKQINDIYVEEFRKRAVQTCISQEFVQNELVKLREKMDNMDLTPSMRMKYELKILEQIEKTLDKQQSKDAVTNIQINNNLPDWDKK